VTTGSSDEDSRVKAEQFLDQGDFLWQGCIDDKVRTEGMADRGFSLFSLLTMEKQPEHPGKYVQLKKAAEAD